MKNILSFELFESLNLLEKLGEDRWPSDWKSMPEWKTLKKLGFYETTTPIQSKNRTIMIANSNPRLAYFYPAGIVLQESGYVRDKGVRSGYIKKFNTDYSLRDLFNYVIDKASKEISRSTKAVETSDLNQEQIDFINKSTRASWDYNKVTKKIDVKGEVLIRPKNGAEDKILSEIMFGKVKGNFIVAEYKKSDMNFLPDVIGGGLRIVRCGLKNLKQFPKKIGGELVLQDNPNLESLDGLFQILPLKILHTDYFTVENPNPESLLEIIEKSLFKFRNNNSESLGTKLIMSSMTPESLSPYFKKEPLKIYMLDEYPKLKKEVLRITGLRDVSAIGKAIASGLI